MRLLPIAALVSMFSFPVAPTDAAPPAAEPAPLAAPSYAESFRELYDTLGRTYPCFELKGIDWAAVGAELLPRVKNVVDDTSFGLLCMELVARLEDNHAALQPGAKPVPMPPVPTWHPGFACTRDAEDRSVVYWVDPNGPSAASGLRPGMTVLEIDGRPAEEHLQETMAFLSKWKGHSSHRVLRYEAMRGFMYRTEPNTPLIVTACDPEGNEIGCRVLCASNGFGAPRRPAPIPECADIGNVNWATLDNDGVGYIRIRRMREDLIPSLDSAVRDLAGARGLVIDVRANTGGGYDRPRVFLNFDPEQQHVEPDRPRYLGPIAILIDGRCISAGEGWTSWFVATERARLFGEATAGASARKTVYELANGLYKVRYPVKPYTGSLDRIIERRGLEPDVELFPTARDLWEGRDTTLEAARAWLQGQGAHRITTPPARASDRHTRMAAPPR